MEQYLFLCKLVPNFGLCPPALGDIARIEEDMLRGTVFPGEQCAGRFEPPIVAALRAIAVFPGLLFLKLHDPSEDAAEAGKIVGMYKIYRVLSDKVVRVKAEDLVGFALELKPTV